MKLMALLLLVLVLVLAALVATQALETAGRNTSTLTTAPSIALEERTLDARATTKKNETKPVATTAPPSPCTQQCTLMDQLGDWDKVQEVCAWDLGAAGSNIFFLFRDGTIVHECGCRNKLQEYAAKFTWWKYWHSDTDPVSCTGPPEFWYGPDYIFGPYLMSCKPRTRTFDSRTKVSTYF